MSIFSKQKMCLNIYLNLTVPVTHSVFPRHSFVCGGLPTQSLIQSSSQSLICHNFLSVQDVQIDRIRVIQTNKDIKMALSCPAETSRCQGAEWSAAWRTALHLTVMVATIVSQCVRQWQHVLSGPRSLPSLSGLAEDNILMFTLRRRKNQCLEANLYFYLFCFRCRARWFQPSWNSKWNWPESSFLNV